VLLVVVSDGRAALIEHGPTDPGRAYSSKKYETGLPFTGMHPTGGSGVDAFGQQLSDVYHEGYPYQIIERSDDFLGVGPGDAYVRAHDEWAAGRCSARSPASPLHRRE
jgi:hypothetical protein